MNNEETEYVKPRCVCQYQNITKYLFFLLLLGAGKGALNYVDITIETKY